MNVNRMSTALLDPVLLRTACPSPPFSYHSPVLSSTFMSSSPVVAAGVVAFLKNLFPGLSLGSSDSQRQAEEQVEEAGEDSRGPVLLVGGTGRTGRRIAERLMEKGRAVVALVSSEERATQVRGEERGEKGREGRGIRYVNLGCEGGMNVERTDGLSERECSTTHKPLLYAAYAPLTCGTALVIPLRSFPVWFPLVAVAGAMHRS